MTTAARDLALPLMMYDGWSPPPPPGAVVVRRRREDSSSPEDHVLHVWDTLVDSPPDEPSAAPDGDADAKAATGSVLRHVFVLANGNGASRVARAPYSSRSSARRLLGRLGVGKRRQILTRTRGRAAIDSLQARRSRTSSCSARSRAHRRRRRPRSSARSRPSRRRTSSSSTTPTTPRRCSRASRSTRSTRPSEFVRSRPPPRARHGAPDALLVPWGRRREVPEGRPRRCCSRRASSLSVVGLVVVVAPAQRSHVGARRPAGAQVPARRARARERAQARLPHHVGRADRRGGLRGGAQRLALGRAGVCVCRVCVRGRDSSTVVPLDDPPTAVAVRCQSRR